MRAPTLALLLTVAAGSAGAQTAGSNTSCASITDSLLRLRCYDQSAPKAAEPIAPVPSTVPSSAAAVPAFSLYPAQIYRGPTRLPDFSGRDREFASFRTRLRDGMRTGPRFAGDQAVVQIGCGTGCSVVYLGDLRTGKVSAFPLGGEDDPSLDLKFRPDSRLMVAKWTTEKCNRAVYLWESGSFRQLSRDELGPAENCW